MMDDRNSPFGDISTPAPHTKHWMYAFAAAMAVHLAVAWPFLPKPAPAILGMGAEEEGILISLAPPEATPPPEIVEEEPPEPDVIEERADSSPPPAPPPVPRELPDIPSIRPQPIPEMWIGGSGGDLTLEEYMTLREWLAAARAEIMGRLSYPYEARANQIGGRATVIITVSRDGRVINWRYKQRTEERILDREIERTMRLTRKLPPLPPEVVHEQLSFTVPIRFEIFYKREPRPGAPGQPAAGAPAATPQEAEGLSAAELSACAVKAGELTQMRNGLTARQTELESLRSEYEEQLERVQRQGREPNVRMRSLMRRYEEGAGLYEAEVAAYNAKAGLYTRQCQSGSASWASYSAACAPYVASGNAYCEAFGAFWVRLRAGG